MKNYIYNIFVKQYETCHWYARLIVSNDTNVISKLLIAFLSNSNLNCAMDFNIYYTNIIVVYIKRYISQKCAHLLRFYGLLESEYSTYYYKL